VTNTVAKIVIDQTIGGAWNIALFIMTMGMLRGLDYDSIVEQIGTVCECNIRQSSSAKCLWIEEFFIFRSAIE
jgi:hypothetical protein